MVGKREKKKGEGEGARERARVARRARLEGGGGADVAESGDDAVKMDGGLEGREKFSSSTSGTRKTHTHENAHTHTKTHRGTHIRSPLKRFCAPWAELAGG